MNRSEAVNLVDALGYRSWTSGGENLVDALVTLGILKLGDDDASAATAVYMRLYKVRSARLALEEVMRQLIPTGQTFEQLQEVLKMLDEAVGQPTIAETGPGPMPTEQEFEALSPSDQQTVVDNMSIPAGYRPPDEWVSELRNASLGRTMELASVLLGHLDSGRWQIISHVPEQYDHTAKHIAEIEEAMHRMSMKNPARARLHKELRLLVGEQQGAPR